MTLSHASEAAAQQDKAPLSLGMNLAAISDWSTEYPFVDVFKTSREWISQADGAGWGQGGPLSLTPDGWVASLQPGQFAETLLFSADPASAQSLDEQYTILYEGEGTLGFRNDNVSVVAQGLGWMVVDITPSQGTVYLQIRETNPGNPLRNIRFLMPGAEPDYQEQPFHHRFLSRTSGFSTLRFMDWMATNRSNLVEWADRPKPSDISFAPAADAAPVAGIVGRRGVPVEVMVTLANRLHANAWFTMPHQASDDYVQQFAAYVRDHLDPELKAFVEYSNEIWNGQFSQASYSAAQGAAQNPELWPDNTFGNQVRFYSLRATQIFAIWEQVFGGTERLVRVLGAQASNPWVGYEIVSYNDAYQHADALAIAPYFSCDDPGNPDSAAEISALTVDELLDRQAANVAQGGCAYQQIEDNWGVANLFNLTLIAYEGGQHLAGWGGAENNQALTDLFIAANRHPRMGQIYLDYLHAWQTLGGGTFVAYNDVGQPGKWGSWGALESITQDPAQAPKFQALRTFAQELGQRAWDEL